MALDERCAAENEVIVLTFHRTPNDKRSDSEWLRRRQRLGGVVTVAVQFPT